jgi:hypothetical protein
VKRTEREGGGERVKGRGGEALNLELEGDPGLGKLMMMGKSPFPWGTGGGPPL